jgi:glucuronate isomerase
MIRRSGWKGRVVTAYRPDSVVDPEFENFRENIERFGELAGTDATSWQVISKPIESGVHSSRNMARRAPITGMRPRARKT